MSCSPAVPEAGRDGVALTGNAELANDLARETMARAHRNWSLVSIADAPNAWLRRVMKNLIIDHFRRRDAEAARSTASHIAGSLMTAAASTRAWCRR